MRLLAHYYMRSRSLSSRLSSVRTTAVAHDQWPILFCFEDLTSIRQRQFSNDSSTTTMKPKKTSAITTTTSWRPKPMIQKRENDLRQQIKDCRSIRAILDLCQKNDTTTCMKPFHVAACWDRVSRLAWDYKELKQLQEKAKLLTPLLKQTISTINQMDSKSLSTTAHRMAKISARSRRNVNLEIWKMLEDRAKEMKSFESMEISNIVWAFARVRLPAPALLDHLADEAIKCMDTFSPRELSNTLWSYATVDFPSPDLFDAAAEEIIRGKKLKKFNAQDISNTLWSYATIGHPRPDLFDAAAGAATRTIENFNSQDISTTLWSYATAGHHPPSPELFDAASEKVIHDLESFNAQAISNTVWSYAMFDHPSPNLFDAASDEAIKKISTFNAQAISNTLWSYASVGHPSSELLFDAAIQAANNNLHAFTKQGLCNTLWSLAATDHHNMKAAAPFLNRILNLHQANQLSLSLEERMQLHQVSLWLYGDQNKKESPIPDDLADKCLSAFASHDQASPSGLQMDIISTFRSMDLVVSEEATCKQTGYSIEAIVTTKNGRELSVHVDDPTSFTGRLPTSVKVLRRIQLNYIGERPLLSIPYWKWDDLGDTKEKQKFLEKEIKKVLRDSR